MDWVHRISSCFGKVDRKFAGHATEEKMARELRKDLKAWKEQWPIVEREFNNWLESEVTDKTHIDAEMKKVDKFFADHLK